MSQPEPRNPEHRSSGAIICFCGGAALCTIAYFLGVGAVIGALISGNDPALVVGSILAAITLGLAAVLGGVLMLVGGIWMIAQVIADQTGDVEEKRYRDVER
jgi:hypothetical protein